MSKGWAVVPAVILAGWMHSIPAAAQSTGSLPVTARVMSQEAGRSYVAALALIGAPLPTGSGTPLPPPQLATITFASRINPHQDARVKPRIIVVQYLKN
ncbi:MAG TPA: hypothetical protein VLT17_06890 [Gemmatimonadales bacterium]|jgi:hypothetical protein|nr:hypothetical protein [Gemmatimonadales bacterium]